mmetsp:Transcript_22246/g.46091  ORF Transcript_22246/g.46091 Transcript_22246/m.46091 type:complete len:282 (+) Transcript_22246:20-865(+)
MDDDQQREPDEVQMRAARQQEAQAALAEFHEQRRRDIEERRQRNRAREESATARAASDLGGARPSAGAGVDLSALLGALTSGPSAADVGGSRPSAGAGVDLSALLGALTAGPSAADIGGARPSAGAGLDLSALLGALPSGLSAGDLQQAPPALQQILRGHPSLLPASGASAAASSAPVQAAAPKPAVRVREAGSTSFRRVVLQDSSNGAEEGQAGGGSTSFVEVEARVCAKFRNVRGPDGNELGERRLVKLVRISDSLEVADDEDVLVLQDGDELEATFAA